MISAEKLSELKTKCEEQEHKTFTDEEWQDTYKLRLRETLVPTPARYREAVMDDIPKIVMDKFPLAKENPKNGFYIWGGVGAGKTHILYAIRHYYAATRLLRFRITNMNELFAEIKNSFSEESKVDIVEESQYYQGYDDIGTEKDTEWAGEQMYRLVNSLYENKKFFVFTSNLSLKQLAGRFGEQGDRIASRIAEMAEVIEVKGDDRRI